MKKWLHEKSQIIFFLTLFCYIGIWITVSYVGVYVTYVAGPVLVISGLVMVLTRPRDTPVSKIE
jgi:hypothetical protein